MAKLISVFILGALLSSCGYNEIQRLDEEVKASVSEVDNQYQRRSELIPNLVSTVKGYAKHEKDTLQSVVEARAKASQTNLNINDAQALAKYESAQGSLSQALSRLLIVAEKYPDLKANENFRDLQAQLEGTENRIAVARKRSIDTVAKYNTMVRSFPYNLTAKYLLKLDVRPTFTVPETTKQVPKVEF